jgi:hypothetical protein
MVGIGRPSAADSVDGGPRQPNDRSSTRPCPQSFFKRKKPSYSFRSLLSTTSPCGCHFVRPVPNADATLPRCCRVPHPALLARPRHECFSPPPVVCSLRPSDVSPARPSQEWCWWRWCARAAGGLVLVRPTEPSPLLMVVVVVLACRRLLPAPTPVAGIGRRLAFPSPMLHMCVSIILEV